MVLNGYTRQHKTLINAIFSTARPQLIWLLNAHSFSSRHVYANTNDTFLCK